MIPIPSMTTHTHTPVLFTPSLTFQHFSHFIRSHCSIAIASAIHRISLSILSLDHDSSTSLLYHYHRSQVILYGLHFPFNFPTGSFFIFFPHWCPFGLFCAPTRTLLPYAAIHPTSMHACFLADSPLPTHWALSHFTSFVQGCPPAVPFCSSPSTATASTGGIRTYVYMLIGIELACALRRRCSYIRCLLYMPCTLQFVDAWSRPQVITSCHNIKRDEWSRKTERHREGKGKEFSQLDPRSMFGWGMRAIQVGSYATNSNGRMASGGRGEEDRGLRDDIGSRKLGCKERSTCKEWAED
ncbi:hypothetical protein L226DRAFT_66951 [Lentinus tigrinus ALCF2SS1-7]|uniref:Uncharacterized protein n=1 Tax=Lentinus tigrinus ALCF2SS1-6 TaxID=1328759 RepID=A0A5C2S8U2_9APHY|nr:hypothetical protein L227DRAFT_107675 [Lentinus tigrinus ALCF2SS1-6]RPD74842.1 hypothetical protein L226DRAFT_66951 [Lentinus tigrinus ALCF2SS1-7]